MNQGAITSWSKIAYRLENLENPLFWPFTVKAFGRKNHENHHKSLFRTLSYWNCKSGCPFLSLFFKNKISLKLHELSENTILLGKIQICGVGQGAEKKIQSLRRIVMYLRKERWKRKKWWKSVLASINCSILFRMSPRSDFM